MQTLLSVPVNTSHFFESLKSIANLFVSHDPQGRRLGSGGGTVHLMHEAHQATNTELSFETWLETSDKCIVHGGGQSRRLPAYSALSKLLTPMPVHRYSQAQKIDQCLIDLQLPFFKKMLSASTANCLIASGDALIDFKGVLPEIPDADVICLGLWESAEVSSHHGVFFCDKEANNLEFMLQKPAPDKIRDLANDYHYLIDAGVWLLSSKAQKVLALKCVAGDLNAMSSESVQNYDLYSDFAAGLGNQASLHDDDINSLTCAIYALDEASFLHFGTNDELITSSQKLQNKTYNQRELYNSHGKKHSDIFTLNADIKYQMCAENNGHIWIENSYIPETWNLSREHILTGIPENSWILEVPQGICLDIVPLKSGKVCVRPYGIRDKFSASVKEGQWLNKTISELFDGTIPEQIRDIDDIQEAPLFPCINREELNEDLIQTLIKGENLESLFEDFECISASEIQCQADLVSLDSQRKSLLQKILPNLAANYKNSVFYQLDLYHLAQIYPLDQLAPPIAESEDLATHLKDALFRAKVHEFNSRESDYEQRAFATLAKSIVENKPEFTKPSFSILQDQILWGRSPARLDLAGGWTDTPPYCFFNGGEVVNLAVNLNGQAPIQAFAKKVTDPHIIIRSIDLGVSEIVKTFDDLQAYDQLGQGFVIPKAALILCGLSKDPHFGHGYDSLEEQLKEMGGGLELTMLCAIPKGSGLGTSSILASTVIGVLSELFNLNWDKMRICQNTLILEQMLTSGGGWQDQFGGVYHGLKYLKTDKGLKQEPRCQCLPDSIFTKPQNKAKILLYYTGITRVAKNILGEIVRGMFLNQAEHLENLNGIRENAKRVYDAILENSYEKVADAVEKSWQLNQALDAGTNTAEIQNILNLVDQHLIGKKLLGAGGGGYILMFAKSTQDAVQLREKLESAPPSPGARFVEISVSNTGFEITTS
ncbi:hypothetical protein LNTAR_04411 [Lentisphaera araneosa HTCC2155]|uniref:Bifunctional fucokinase/L-fucose-1-P-guanylyltransferase n=1 Tax=Lentisphaera araneosa HTCC2155 TaxID=313628 RepID=A6DQI1_9BACT|nr:bifunctional fucokinase/fucose-1-phosphate guanylyltransferase [Lentisphaera araneosa]EDM26062.1 hypothetical protein LNTAR_04411 [Lentisphaera araneosa HTCC2155]